MVRGAGLPAQIQCAVDQADVTVGLREISEHPSQHRVVFFGEQADVVAARQQALEYPPGFGVAALQHVIVDQPEAAREKGAFPRGQTITRVIGLVAQDEFAVDQQLPLDRTQCTPHPRILGGEEIRPAG